MKTKQIAPYSIVVRFASIILVALVFFSCSGSKSIPDRLLGLDLVKLETQLARQVENGKIDLTYRLAEVLFLQGKYRDAYDNYQRADVLGQLTSTLHQRNFVHCGKILGFSTPYDTDTGYFDKNLKFPVQITPFCGNSTNEDIAPYQWGEHLFVTSSRQATEQDYPVSGKPFLNVLAFVENCVPISLPDVLPPNLNTSHHDGPIAISKEGNLVIINRNYRRPNKDNYRHLFFDYYVREENGRWGKAIMFPYCDADYSVQHPFFKDEEQALYYSSDKPGGFGGFDLYKSAWDGQNWGEPQNLGSEINTVYDEVFPVFTLDGDLVYSTNHLETWGGLDLALYKEGKRFLFPQPLNTVYDDFGLTFSNEKTGYFASTRDRGPFTDNIFMFKTYDPYCKNYFVLVREKSTGNPIEGVVVRYNAIEVPARDQLVTGEQGRSFVICHPSELEWPVAFQAEKQGYNSLAVSTTFEYLPEENIYLAILELDGPVELFTDPPPHVASGNIVVYFENDIPRPASIIPSYDDTYQDYLAVRDRYLDRSINTRAEMGQFFAKVDLGMSSLRDLASYVYENIGQNKLEIFLQAFASPLSNPVYNAKLSERRNTSMINYLMNWNGGKLAPYFNNGQIKVEAIPFGDTQAPTTVSGSIQDKARSVYSVEASRERRVTVFWHWISPDKEALTLRDFKPENATAQKEKPGLKETARELYYVVVGSFPKLDAANNLKEDLKRRGYLDVGIVLSEDGNYHRVYAKSYNTSEQAVEGLRKFRSEINKDSWILGP